MAAGIWVNHNNIKFNACSLDLCGPNESETLLILLHSASRNCYVHPRMNNNNIISKESLLRACVAIPDHQ